MTSQRNWIFALIFALLPVLGDRGICSENDSKEIAPTDCLQERDHLKDSEYWKIKDAFNEASQHWNIDKSQEPDSHFFVASNVIDCLRSDYVTALNKLWPKLTEDNGYALARISLIRETLTDSNKLRNAVSTFLDDYISEQESPQSIVERMNKPYLGVKGQGDAITVPFVRHQGTVKIWTDRPTCDFRLKGGRLDQQLSLNSAYSKAPVSVFERTIILNEGTYEAVAALPGANEIRHTFTIKAGETVELSFIFGAIIKPSPTVKPNALFPDSRVKYIEKLLSGLETEEGPGSVYRYDFRRFYSPMINGFVSTATGNRKTWDEYAKTLDLVYHLVSANSLVPSSGRGYLHDGTNEAPDPAFNSGYLNVILDFSDVEDDPVYSVIDRQAFTNDVVSCLVEWGNARRRALQPPHTDPLSAFSVNAQFFVKAHIRLTAEGKGNPLYGRTMPFLPVGDGRDGIVVNNYVHWDINAYNLYRGQFPLTWRDSEQGKYIIFGNLAEARNDQKVVIKFSKHPENRGSEPEVIATAEINRGVELHCNEKTYGSAKFRFVFVPERLWPSFATTIRASDHVTPVRFAFVILHELGHFFGCPHLPSMDADELGRCVMDAKYDNKRDPVLTIPDVLAFNTRVFLGPTRLGTLCDGLIFGETRGE